MNEGPVVMRLLALGSVLIVVYGLYRYEFNIKRALRRMTCNKKGHRWVSLYGLIRQCCRCYRVEDEEVYGK